MLVIRMRMKFAYNPNYCLMQQKGKDLFLDVADGGNDDDLSGDYDDDGDNDDDDNDDIYIMMKCLSVCLSVTKNEHFLLLVSCNHLNHP